MHTMEIHPACHCGHYLLFGAEDQFAGKLAIGSTILEAEKSSGLLATSHQRTGRYSLLCLSECLSQASQLPAEWAK